MSQLTRNETGGEAALGYSLLLAACLLLATSVATAAAGSPGSMNSVGVPAPTATDICLRSAADAAAITEALALIGSSPDADERIFWVYAKYGFHPIWHRAGRLTEAGWRLRGRLTRAGLDGLDPARYDPLSLWPAVLVARPGDSAARQAARMDLRLTQAFLDFADDMITGPALLGQGIKGWHIGARKVDAEAVLDEAARSAEPDAALARLIPRQPEYGRLQQALKRYRALAAEGDWQPLPPGPILRRGDSDPAVRVLTARLLRTGEIDQASARSADQRFDRGVEAAVKRFQERHGLKPDGRVGPDTRKALSAPVGELVQRIELQLARWRELPADLGERYLLVNIPEYRLRLFEHGQVTLEMKVIVGQDDWPTPVFADKVEYVVFNPYWTVPRHIAVRELLPLLQRDPRYLERKHMEVRLGGQNVDPSGIDWKAYTARTFPYQLRQRPGPDNALGLVKFLLPNPYAVYLHDTPTAKLFAEAKRNLSHGCIRVEKPAELVDRVLDESSPEVGHPLVAGRKPHWVRLREPLPIYMVYFTVYVERDGEVRFFDDLYGYDAQMYARLRRPPRPELRSASGGPSPPATL